MREFIINDGPQSVDRIMKGHKAAMAELKSVLVEMLEEYEHTMQAHETWYRLEVPTDYDGWEKAYYQIYLAKYLAGLCCAKNVITQEHYHWLNRVCNDVQDMLVQRYYPENYYNSDVQSALLMLPVPAEEYDHGDC